MALITETTNPAHHNYVWSIHDIRVIVYINCLPESYLLVPLPLAEPFVPIKEKVPVFPANHLSFAALTRAAAREGFTSSKPMRKSWEEYEWISMSITLSWGE